MDLPRAWDLRACSDTSSRTNKPGKHHQTNNDPQDDGSRVAAIIVALAVLLHQLNHSCFGDPVRLRGAGSAHNWTVLGLLFWCARHKCWIRGSWVDCGGERVELVHGGRGKCRMRSCWSYCRICCGQSSRNVTVHIPPDEIKRGSRCS